MKYSLTRSPEKFFRAFDKTLSPHRLFSRLTLADTDTVVGKRKGNRFFFYRKKKGLFSLFALTLYGKEKNAALSLSFSRSRPLLLFYLLWCTVLIFTGLELIFTEPLFALWFLVPGILFLFPVLFFSKKEKQALLNVLALLEEKSDFENNP